MTITDAATQTPRRIITEVSGFTPIFDVLVQQYGDETIAAVFGAIWRYCQMEDGVCRASLDTIGQSIGVDKSTVMRHAKTLCDDGYIKDLSPDLRHRPHIYADTGKISMRSKIETVAQRNTNPAPVAPRNPTVAQRNATVAENQLSKDSIKESEEKTATTTTPAPARTEPTPPARPNTYALYEGNIGPLTPLVSDELKDLEVIYTPAWVERAITEAARSGVRNLKYIGAVLQGYKKRGSPDIGRDFVNKGAPQTAAPASRAPANNSLDAIRRVAQRTAPNAR